MRSAGMRPDQDLGIATPEAPQEFGERLPDHTWLCLSVRPRTPGFPTAGRVRAFSVGRWAQGVGRNPFGNPSDDA